MQDKRKADKIAAQRLQLLAPLLAEGLDPAKELKLRKELAEKAGLSERTMRRYLEQYRNGGFQSLAPKSRGIQPKDTVIPEEVLEQAILLRREVPGRSISQIIQILEWEGLIEFGTIKRSTLQERLSAKGYSSRQMRLYQENGVAARRFQHKYRNQLWHSEIKFGPYLPIGPGGKLKQVYLIAFLDDSTRYILHGEFYPIMDQAAVEDCFRQSIHKYGIPETVYFDNGKQYRTKMMIRICSKLGIRLLYAKPYSPESTGKIERFNRVIDSFLAEVSIAKPNTLEELNRLFSVWLEECYQDKLHSALNEGKSSPYTAFQSDRKPLKFEKADNITNAFLHLENRRVDKAGCISFMSKKYEVGLSLIGCNVDIIYDPACTEILTVEYQGHAPFTIKELQIGARVAKRPEMPVMLTPVEPKESRLLNAASKKNEKRKTAINQAVSYRSLNKGDTANV